MKNNDLNEAIKRSIKIRETYHQLEQKYHESEWTIEEDALALLTDASLVGRLTMANQGRWPSGEDSDAELEHKIGECMWWLIVLSNRMNIDSNEALENFLAKTETKFNINNNK